MLPERGSFILVWVRVFCYEKSSHKLAAWQGLPFPVEILTLAPLSECVHSRTTVALAPGGSRREPSDLHTPRRWPNPLPFPVLAPVAECLAGEEGCVCPLRRGRRHRCCIRCGCYRCGVLSLLCISAFLLRFAADVPVVPGGHSGNRFPSFYKPPNICLQACRMIYF